MRSFVNRSSGFYKLFIAVTAALTFVLIYVIKDVQTPSTSLALSNLLQAAIVLWAACSCGYVAWRSSGYLKRLWAMLTGALFLAFAAQGLETYYQSFTHLPAFIPWPSDILFFLWVTPAAVMFLPSGSHEGPADWAKALDYAQVGVVALATYLYFFYIPWHSEAAGPEMLGRILRVYVLRDGLLAIGFVLYASLVQTRVIRTFLRQMAAFFLLGIIFPLCSLLMPAPIRSRAHWADLIWCAPFIFASIVAANWTPPPQELVMQAERPLVRGRFASHVLPILIPLLVLFMGRRIATEQMTLAWITITASFVLSSGHLFLANERQR